MTTTFKSVPLVASGHTRPVTHLSFSPLQDDQSYLLISSCKDGSPMLRDWTGDWIGTFIGHKGAVWSSKISRDTSRAASGSADFTAYASPVLNSTRRSLIFLPHSKIWDTFTGQSLHSFPHNHIVRAVALSSNSSHLLTGGQEKKVRIFDVNQPDASPDFFEDTNGLAHEGTIKSVIWGPDNRGVTAGEDGYIKYVPSLTSPKPLIDPSFQVVGPEDTIRRRKHPFPHPNHLHGIINSNQQTRRHLWQNRTLHLRYPERLTHSQCHPTLLSFFGFHPSHIARSFCYRLPDG